MIAKILAQDIMDAYYGDYRSEEQFFEWEDFFRQAGYVYSKILNTEYERRRAELRAMGASGEQMVSLDESWLVHEQVSVESKDFIELKQAIFSFPFSQSSASVQDVVSIDYGCMLARTRKGNLWKLRYAPKGQSITWWWVESPSRIGLKKSCDKGSVEVLYVPQFSADLEVADAFAADIQVQVLNLMFSAQKSQVIDTTNDGNPNKTIETEVNTDGKR